MKNEDLLKISKQVRIAALRAIFNASSGHPGGSLSSADVLVFLYFGGAMRFRPEDPKWPERDYFILSNGHVCPSYYAVLALAGFLKMGAFIGSLRSFGSGFEGHPLRGSLPGIETTTGSLGQGIGVAAGIAKGLKMKNLNNRVFCLTSDGEHQEGSTWEAIMFAGHHKLNNLSVIIDRNNMQIGGKTEEINRLEPLEKRYSAFGWRVILADGHDFLSLSDAFMEAKKPSPSPVVIIAKTVRGKGVSFMENSPDYHAKKLTKEELERAIEELKTGN